MKFEIIKCLIIIGIAVLCLVLAIGTIKAIVESDMQEWLKFWLLTR